MKNIVLSFYPADNCVQMRFHNIVYFYTFKLYTCTLRRFAALHLTCTGKSLHSILRHRVFRYGGMRNTPSSWLTYYCCVFSFFLCFSALSLAAQSEHLNREAIAPLKESQLFIGAQLSPGYSTLLPYRNTVFHPAYQAGLLARYELKNNFGLSSGLAYSREGLAFKTGDQRNSLSLHYLRVPLLLLYRFDCGIKDLCPEAGVGAAAGYLLTKEQRSMFRPFDAGLQSQIGFRYRLLRGLHLHFCLQHFRGLTDMLSTNRIKDHNQSTRLQLSLLGGF
jgi:hypothetical protein